MSAAGDQCDLPADRRRGSNFGWSLGMVLRRWQEYAEEALKDLPHGSRGYHILAVVVHEAVPTQGALAARLVIDRSVLTYVIDDLENAGLIERQLDPRDRRARRIVATERGRRALADAERRGDQRATPGRRGRLLTPTCPLEGSLSSRARRSVARCGR
ncbi:MarR family winged helix-turn-helix transcriptional regulator [Micromonospora sp. CPCC 205558]|uniref:MarR family winged helix-turn-helix transcriptional regulator n=1 Tax=Micromonospora sp. CPCC 205558 TaxID=3122403 RepID=UPI002FEE7218